MWQDYEFFINLFKVDHFHDFIFGVYLGFITQVYPFPMVVLWLLFGKSKVFMLF
jgi:hypothetical protein